MDDELGERRIERLVREWQVLGGRPIRRDAGIACLHGADEGRGRIDGRNVRGPDPSNQLGSERAGSAAHVEDPLTVAHAREVGHLGRQKDRIPAHEPVVCLGGDIEAHRPNLRSRPATVTG